MMETWIEEHEQHPGRAPAGDGSAVIDLADMAWDACERTIGRLLQVPSLGFTREHNDRVAKTLDSWLHLCRTSFECRLALGAVWVRALEELVAELESLSAKGESVRTLPDLLALWTEVGERAMVEDLGSDEYARVQGRFLNAAMAFRLREREMVEPLFQASHIPTRREMEEVTRGIYELRKEVRRLERRLEEGEGRPEAPRREQPPAGGKPVPQASEQGGSGDRGNGHRGDGSVRHPLARFPDQHPGEPGHA